MCNTHYKLLNIKEASCYLQVNRIPMKSIQRMNTDNVILRNDRLTFFVWGQCFFSPFFIECPPKYSHNVVSFEEVKHHLLLDRHRRTFNMSNMIGATSRARTVYSSGAAEFIPVCF